MKKWEKRCFTCRQVQPYEHFHKDRSQPDGLCHICKTCSVVKLRERRKRLRGARRKPAPNCEICGTDITAKGAAKLDHCHVFDVFRGWLCNGCNIGLGHFKDSVTALRRAAEYLERALHPRDPHVTSGLLPDLRNPDKPLT